MKFIWGKAGSNDCQKPSQDNIIQDRSTCVTAEGQLKEEALAADSSAKWASPIPAEQMDTPHAKYNHHPRGCWRGEGPHCEDNATGCFYFNNNDGDGNPTGDPDNANKITGTPLCYRKLYIDGTPSSNDCGDAEYVKITNFSVCSEMASCMTKQLGAPNTKISEIIVEGAGPKGPKQSEESYADYPEGCFVDAETNHLYFNDATAEGKTPATAATLKGTLICMHKSS
jgi:hypothetical protein